MSGFSSLMLGEPTSRAGQRSTVHLGVVVESTQEYSLLAGITHVRWCRTERKKLRSYLSSSDWTAPDSCTSEHTVDGGVVSTDGYVVADRDSGRVDRSGLEEDFRVDVDLAVGADTADLSVDRICRTWNMPNCPEPSTATGSLQPATISMCSRMRREFEWLRSRWRGSGWSNPGFVDT